MVKDTMAEKKNVQDKAELRTKFVMLCNPRSGSNYFSELLNAHPDIWMHEEYFNPITIAANHRHFKAPYKLYKIAPLRYLEHFWQVRRVLFDSCCIRGFKLFQSQQPQVYEFILHEIDVRKIILTRENYLEQFISFQRAAYTEIWHSGMHNMQSIMLKRAQGIIFHALRFHFEWMMMHIRASAKRILRLGKKEILLEIDTNNFFQFAKDIEAQRQHFKEVEESTGQSYFWVSYEELTSPQREQKLNEIWHFLGASSWKGEIAVRYKKQRKDSLQESIANYDEVAAALKGTEYEWMVGN